MNNILIDQLKIAYPKFQTEQKEGKILNMYLDNFPSEGIKVIIYDSALTIDFKGLKLIPFEMIQIFFFERLKFGETALYEYNSKKELTLYFRNRKSTPFKEAMWKYGIFKNVVEVLKKFNQYVHQK